MNLSIVTPTSVVVDSVEVRYVRAEDATGAFGIQPGHESFVTVLAVSVLTYRDQGGVDHHVAVRGGVLAVRDGTRIEVATREAVTADDLVALEGSVLDVFRQRTDAEAAERARTKQLRAGAIQQICRYLRTGKDSSGPMTLGTSQEVAGS
ncbi:MAG: F0F1 ATP synthase subunit epsilon [Planctomycetes bacterium]|nr:F0F1 ATP synthase subunit epsilon [Planctomycetota bacterium]